MKKQNFKKQADLLKALAHHIRLKIVYTLSEEKKCVCELTDLFNISQSSVSKHLKILKKAGIIKSQKKGMYVYYSLSTNYIIEILSLVKQILIDNYEKDSHLL